MDAEEDRGSSVAEEADLLFNPFPGRITPDPLALLLRDASPTSESLARLERRATVGVRARDVADALRERLARPQTYVVRWRDR